jgi:F0F1-type ATP synthase delta subunit
MKKKFNITGLCFPQEHYMADVSKKLARTFNMVDSGEYFIINRPRQYGKTTTLYAIADMLQKTGEYIILNISFEGIGDDIFRDEKVFSAGFVRILERYAEAYAPALVNWMSEKNNSIDSIRKLSSFVSELVQQADKKIVLMIDEVDKSSNNQLFVSFLAMLRNKYLTQVLAKTFHSVVLAGLNDIKSLKLKLRPESEQKYNSPWNIAAEFTVDMNLQPSEIVPMLEEYARDKQVTLDPKLIAERLFYYTSGYPFLVSKLCKIIDEQLLPQKTELSWALEDVETAFQQLTRETNTNFESLAKNLDSKRTDSFSSRSFVLLLIKNSSTSLISKRPECGLSLKLIHCKAD